MAQSSLSGHYTGVTAVEVDSILEGKPCLEVFMESLGSEKLKGPVKEPCLLGLTYGRMEECEQPSGEVERVESLLP